MRRNNIVKKTEAFCDALDLKHEEYVGSCDWYGFWLV